MQASKREVGRPRWYVVRRGEEYLAPPRRRGGLWGRWVTGLMQAALFASKAQADKQASHYDGASAVPAGVQAPPCSVRVVAS
jgi:hypothetical protein